jgi:hypothetical protein
MNCLTNFEATDRQICNALLDYNEVREFLSRCPDLAGLDEISAAALFWRGEQQALSEGEVIYAEGARLDNTFCLLLAGDLIVEKGAMIIGGIWEQQIFGEMAYFTREQARTATVRVGSMEAVILKFQLTPAELSSPQFANLKRYLGLHSWDRFVSTWQGAV